MTDEVQSPRALLISVLLADGVCEPELMQRIRDTLDAEDVTRASWITPQDTDASGKWFYQPSESDDGEHHE